MTEIQYGIQDQHPPPAVNSLKRILSVEDDIVVARAPFGQPDVHDVQLNSATSGQPSRTLLHKRSGWRPPAKIGYASLSIIAPVSPKSMTIGTGGRRISAALPAGKAANLRRGQPLTGHTRE